MENVIPNMNEQNERLFTDYLSRQPINNPKDFTLDIDNFRSQNPELAQQLIKDPSKYYVIIKKFLEKLNSQNQFKKKTQTKIEHFTIKMEGNLGPNFVTPRGLNSRMANELVGIQGIITKMELTKFYLQKSVHHNDKTGNFEVREYPDSFNPQKDNDINRARTIKSYDQNQNPLTFQFGHSTFKDSQMVVIQQLPQMAPPGLLPMSVPVVLQNNLVATVKPGDRVQMVGIYKLVAGLNSKEKGIFRPFFVCLSIKPLTQVSSANKKPAKLDFHKDEIYELFSRSVAPSVWGHEYLKKAVLLMLVGGVQKVLENNTHLRGDINLLMVGDPGTAKSQMLRWVLSTVDVSVGTTGSGASGVGLTAAIVTDKDTGQKTLQAGAMVLADRGVVCIDQFDKMNQTDRVAVHEVMEQQTVTIAKAGLHCSLNARCSVIAAANPIYGQYQPNMPPTKNVGMPDSLLSRFDLIFIILDQKNPTRDSQIAEKVCRNHRLAPQSNDFLNQYMDSQEYVVNPIQDKKNEDAVYEKNNIYKGDGNFQILNQNFLKRYVNWVKNNVHPELTDDAVKLAAQLWARLRQKDKQSKETNITKVLPITIRTYESLIRLSTAHAKLLQSRYVEAQNVIEAFRLLMYCMQGDQYHMQEEIEEICNDNNIDYAFKKGKKKTNARNKITETKQQTMKMQVEEGLRKKMQKLNFKENERQADEALRKHVSKETQFNSNERAIVYKAIADMIRKQKGNVRYITVSLLYYKWQRVQLRKKKLQTILKNLENDTKISMEEDNIYLV